MTSSSKLRTADLAAISSIDDVLWKLDQLNRHLNDTPLEKLITFNKAYSVITSAIQAASVEQYFNNPKDIEVFTVCFARYYFAVINDILSGKEVVPAWSRLVETSANRQRLNFISLLMGANAHINYDLPLTLREMIDGGHNRGLVKDLAKIDRLIMKSGREILESFNETNKFVAFIKNHFRFIYLKPVMYIVLYWRIIAWRNYKLLKNNRIDALKLSKHSTKIFKYLDFLGRHLGNRSESA
jgi:hypothetical protein